jgi:uncharacterized protein (TIGR02246 family)
MSLRLMAMLSVLFLVVLACRAADNDAERQALHAVVSKSAERYVKAFADRDAKALAALFTPEAEYVDASGVIFHGRAAIEAEYSASFQSDPPGKIGIELISIRPIAAGLVVEDGISTFTPKEGDLTSQIRYTATHVKLANGTWLIASIRELETGRMSPHDRLQALAWLVGKWHEEVKGSVITTEWKWSDDRNYLLGEFSIRHLQGSEWSGTQRIGWDAERNQFRSWIFQSTGAALDGWWRSADDGVWSVSLSGVDADGVRSSTVMSYERDTANSLVISQTQRVRGGESLPAQSHRVVRQPPTPGTAAVPPKK